MRWNETFEKPKRAFWMARNDLDQFSRNEILFYLKIRRRKKTNECSFFSSIFSSNKSSVRLISLQFFTEEMKKWAIPRALSELISLNHSFMIYVRYQLKHNKKNNYIFHFNSMNCLKYFPQHSFCYNWNKQEFYSNSIWEKYLAKKKTKCKSAGRNKNPSISVWKREVELLEVSKSTKMFWKSMFHLTRSFGELWVKLNPCPTLKGLFEENGPSFFRNPSCVYSSFLADPSSHALAYFLSKRVLGELFATFRIPNSRNNSQKYWVLYQSSVNLDSLLSKIIYRN